MSRATLAVLLLFLALGSSAVERGECTTDWQLEVRNCLGLPIE